MIEEYNDFDFDDIDYDTNVTPMDYIIKFKNSVMGSGYCNAEQLKKLICDWIDFNMTHSIS